MSGDEAAVEIVRALQALAEENESWEWQAPVGPGNASYANGYENGRRAVGADLRDLLAAFECASPPTFRCDTCRDTGRVDWMIENDPTCSQEPDEGGTLPCPDCIIPPSTRGEA